MTPSRRHQNRRRGWRFYALLCFALPAVCLSAVLGYYYVTFARLIDARLRGESDRTLPLVYARPFELSRGEVLSDRELVDRLNDLGYAHRARIEREGEFAVGQEAVALIPRAGELAGRTVRVVFRGRSKGDSTPRRIDRIEVLGDGRRQSITLDAPLLTALKTEGREKRRHVRLDQIPRRVIDAVLAIEDRRFYSHPGVDIIRTIGAAVTNLRGNTPYLVGGSTISQQLVKNFFLTREKTIKRKLLEQFMAIVLERRLSKDEILELYLNEVYLGQRGSFAIHGVAEGARLFFGKDVGNVSLTEAALIAGVIQSPQVHSPFRAPDRARDRRNVVLRAMAECGFISSPAAERASAERVIVVERALEAEAPYFVDLVRQTLAEQHPKLALDASGVEIHTTLDLHLQRIAQDSLRAGITKVEALLSKRKRALGVQAVLLAVDPRTGDVLSLVGGRSYNQSQFNRATGARRQPGSIFKPFVYLASFEQGIEYGRPYWTPATLVVDEPTTFFFEEEIWNPGNFGDEYDGPITLRRALAMSRNIAAIKVAEATGYDYVAALWRRVGLGTPPRPYPSIALGVFEATPFEIATAYTIFPNLGVMRPLRTIDRVQVGDDALPQVRVATRRVARPDTTFLVTNMMRSVLTEGTGASAGAAGFTANAAGKSGTTNDLRDAWFVGFTPELLTVVWVGFDGNQPLGLSGTQAALPIWTNFMLRAVAGRSGRTFEAPEGIAFVEIDRDSGRVAGPWCTRRFTEAFIAGTEPLDACDLHPF